MSPAASRSASGSGLTITCFRSSAGLVLRSLACSGRAGRSTGSCSRRFAGADGRDAAEDGGGAGETGEIAALQPLGGYKGHCLGMLVEILCALLAGMPFDHELTHLYAPPYDTPRQVAHLFLEVILRC